MVWADKGFEGKAWLSIILIAWITSFFLYQYVKKVTEDCEKGI